MVREGSGRVRAIRILLTRVDYVLILRFLSGPFATNPENLNGLPFSPFYYKNLGIDTF